MYQFLDLPVADILAHKTADSAYQIYHAFLAQLTEEFCKRSVDIESQVRSKLTKSHFLLSLFVRLGDPVEYHSFALVDTSKPPDELHIAVICAPRPGAGSIMLYHLHNLARRWGKQYITLQSIILEATYHFYRTNGFYLDRPVYATARGENLPFKQAAATTSNIVCTISSNFTTLTQVYPAVYRTALQYEAITSTLPYIRAIQEHYSPTQQALIEQVAANVLTLTHNCASEVECFLVHAAAIEQLYKQVQPLVKNPTFLLVSKADKEYTSKRLARQQLYRERYLYNGQTLIPMIKPLQAMVTVHDAEGNTLAVSPTKYANKTDEELIGLYQVGRK